MKALIAIAIILLSVIVRNKSTDKRVKTILLIIAIGVGIYFLGYALGEAYYYLTH